MVVVPAMTAAALGGFTIYQDASGWLANGRVENLAQLNVSVVRLAQALEDERDLSAGYAANRVAMPDLAGRLRSAQEATASAGQAVRARAAGIRTAAGYQAAIAADLVTLLGSLTDLQRASPAVWSSPVSASKSIQVLADQAIQAADTFSASVGNGSGDADLNGNATALGALLRVENQMSVQRGVLFVALSSSPPMLTPAALTTLLQAQQQQAADQAEFTVSGSQGVLANFAKMAGGAAAGPAREREALALTNAVSGLPLTALNNVSNPKLTAPGWYGAMTATISGTRQVAGQVANDIATRASTLRSQATSDLLVTSALTVLLLGLVVLVSTVVAQSLVRPLRKLRLDALDVASRRLPEMVRRLSESEGAGDGVEIEPIGVASTDEIGEVARAFDQVHREAVRLAAHEAMLRGNLNAMFVNLSRRSQSLVERQLGIIESLEQSEQDPDRLSRLFRLDHLATRMRRNSENLLVLAGHEDARKWSQPVSLVDAVRAAISEIEQYERIAVNIQPGVLITGRAASDFVRLTAELVENAAMFSPDNTQVLVTGQQLTSGGVLIEITDKGLGITDQELKSANWQLDNPPVIDVEVSRRMGLFVVGRLAARHGIRVRLRNVQPSGLSALVWLPGTVAELETVATIVPAPTAARRSVKSDWFRRSDKSIGAAEIQPLASSWASPADHGFPAARAVASPAAGEANPAGLPRRTPNANVAPGSFGWPAGQQAAGARRRSPAEVGNRLADFQRGAHQARSDTPWNFGAEK
jgi:signal transduction histidine kinase